MKVLQVLPTLNSGGVERGTIDFAGELVLRGHQSLVMSAGGAMVEQLETAGSTHIEFPVHRKSPTSLFKVAALRNLLIDLKPDLIHVRSRVPAWMTWLAMKKMTPGQRPALVSTFHGLYSVSRYSEIMGCGDQVIAISQCVRDYIVTNYPRIPVAKISVIHRGVDTREFNPQNIPDADWQRVFFSDHPQLVDKPLILMPGRLSRWKGQPEFIDLIAALIGSGVACHGVVVGGAQPGKESYEQELRQLVRDRDLNEHITFLGHRSDIVKIYPLSRVVLNLSQHAEPFGRTVIEALAMGVPVVSYDYGGPAESLRECFPRGLVPLQDGSALRETVASLLGSRPRIELPAMFTLTHQADATLKVYETALQ